MEELKKVTTSQNRIDLLHASSIDTLEDIIYHYSYHQKRQYPVY